MEIRRVSAMGGSEEWVGKREVQTKARPRPFRPVTVHTSREHLADSLPERGDPGPGVRSHVEQKDVPLPTWGALQGSVCFPLQGPATHSPSVHPRNCLELTEAALTTARLWLRRTSLPTPSGRGTKAWLPRLVWADSKRPLRSTAPSGTGRALCCDRLAIQLSPLPLAARGVLARTPQKSFCKTMRSSVSKGPRLD